MKKANLITIVILSVLLVSACSPQATPAPATAASATIQPTQTLVPTIEPTNPPTEALVPTTAPTSAPTNVSVATATGSSTGMLDLGALLTPGVTAIAEGTIDWDLGAHGWNKYPGLKASEIAYMDTGVDGEQMVKNLPGQPDGTVVLPDHAVLICGGTDAKVELTNGFSKAHADGFYFVLLPHTQIKSLWVKNGFCLVVDESQAQQEFAARVAQAISSKWAYGHVYQPEEWPALTGTYSTPLNSNR